MKTIFIILASTLALLTLSFKSSDTDTQSSRELYAEIRGVDSLLFVAFNTRDMDKFKVYFDKGLELYQDNTGVRNYKESMAAFADLFHRDYVLTRTLVPGSLEVYAIKGFGAIETGRHTFSHVENGKPESATFKFLHIWKKTKSGWKITRLVTYDHPEH